MNRFLKRWESFDNRQKIIVSIAGGLALLWLADSAALRPLRERLRELKQEVETTEQRLLKALALDAQAASIKQAFENYKPYANRAKSRETEIAEVLTEVESAVRASGMVLLNLRPTSASDASDSIGVTLDAESKPGELMQLLSAIARSKRLLRVSELHIRVSEDKTLRNSIVVSKLLLDKP